MHRGREVHAVVDLGDCVPQECIHLVQLPASEMAMHRLRSDVFGFGGSDRGLVFASTSEQDFSWEIVNRALFTEDRFSEAVSTPEVLDGGARIMGGHGAVVLLPSVLGHPAKLESARHDAGAAVILVRRGITSIVDFDAMIDLFRATDFPIRGVVLFDCTPRRWRKWRRFASSYGVWSDPERPWPAIDVLDAEKIRADQPRSPRR